MKISANWILYCSSTRLYKPRWIAFLCIGVLAAVFIFGGGPFDLWRPLFISISSKQLIESPPIKELNIKLDCCKSTIYLCTWCTVSVSLLLTWSSPPMSWTMGALSMVWLASVLRAPPVSPTTTSGLSKTRRHRTHSQHLDAGRAPGHNQPRPQEQPTTQVRWVLDINQIIRRYFGVFRKTEPNICILDCQPQPVFNLEMCALRGSIIILGLVWLGWLAGWRLEMLPTPPNVPMSTH